VGEVSAYFHLTMKTRHLILLIFVTVSYFAIAVISSLTWAGL